MGARSNFNGYYQPTLAEMVEHGVKAYVRCNKCSGQREIDIPALIEKVGPGYSLFNRRSRCKLNIGCDGWNSFMHSRSAVLLPLRDNETADRWIFNP